MAQAAALGSANMLNPLKKLATIGALAGFVLRLFRSKVSGPESTNPVKAKVKPMYGQCAAKPRRQAAPASALEKGGTGHGQG
ncbi:hypothetical protein SAMN05444173_2978 [Opitutus sp. GAS368]|nr:hypothetical protein SAMN05444173_2978 [Opitutus sp. GAS368]